MPLKVSRRSAIAPFIVMDVMRAANARDALATSPAERVVHLEIGQPSTLAPRAVREAAREALERDRIGYTEALGVPALRARIARHYRETYGIAVPIERVVVTTGSSGAFLLAFLAAFDAGDRVALGEPAYPAYRNILRALDIEALGLATGPASRFQPDRAILDGAHDLAGLIIASPANPSGSMLSAEALGDVVAWCRRHGVRLIADEIYHGITYDQAAPSALAYGDDVVVINSFSKYYSMTGWRLGWMIVPPDLARAVEVLAQNLFISPPTLPQLAALGAFEAKAELDANVARYRANRDYLLAELPRIGFERFAPPDGAFYLYADVRHLTNDSEAFCARLLAEAGIAATPGTDFDTGGGRGYVRLSYAGSENDMHEAVRRLARWRIAAK